VELRRVDNDHDGADANGATEADHSADPLLLIVDREARRCQDVGDLVTTVGSAGDIICLGDSLEDDEVVHLLRNNPLDHIISDPSSLDESELVVTSVKLLSGDIFGLEKYLAWGAKVHEAPVRSYEDKRSSLLTIADYAKDVGARRQVIAKIESVTDELLMNALYDAPAVSRGETPCVPSPGGTFIAWTSGMPSTST